MMVGVMRGGSAPTSPAWPACDGGVAACDSALAPALGAGRSGAGLTGAAPTLDALRRALALDVFGAAAAFVPGLFSGSCAPWTERWGGTVFARAPARGPPLPRAVEDLAGMAAPGRHEGHAADVRAWGRSAPGRQLEAPSGCGRLPKRRGRVGMAIHAEPKRL